LVQPILFESLSVSLIVLVDLHELVVFVTGMIFHLSWDVSSSPEPSSSDLKIGLVTVHTVKTESPLSEVRVSSLKETLAGVASLEEHLSFTWVLVVQDLPCRPALVIEVLPEPIELSSLGLLVFGCLEASLPVIDVEWGRG